MELTLGACTGADDADTGRAPHVIERPGELGVPVPDQEPDHGATVTQVQEELAGLLGHPWAGRVGGDTGQVHPSAAEFDDEQHECAAQCDLREVAHPTMLYSLSTALSPIEPCYMGCPDGRVVGGSSRSRPSERWSSACWRVWRVGSSRGGWLSSPVISARLAAGTAVWAAIQPPGNTSKRVASKRGARLGRRVRGRTRRSGASGPGHSATTPSSRVTGPCGRPLSAGNVEETALRPARAR